MKINFRPSTSVRPNLASTRAGEKLEFIDLGTVLKKKEDAGGEPEDPAI